MDDPQLQQVLTLADDTMWPAADAVDRGEVPVDKQLDQLAAAGLYGAAVPRESDGLGLTERQFRRTVETLAGADLTTTFVWIQHQGVAKRLARSEDEELRRRWLPDMAGGRVRAGVGVGGVRPPAPSLTAHREGPDWVLDGVIPWVTGWGLIDVLLIAARVAPVPGTDAALAGQDVVWLLADAPRPIGDTTEQIVLDHDAVTTNRYHLVALDHTRSASVQLDGFRVPADRLLGRQTAREWAAADAAGLRTNGSLSLGLAGRCHQLLDGPEVELAGAIDRTRRELDSAEISELPAVRAAAAALAWTAAGRLLVARGGRSVARRDSAQRLAREAMVLQVFGTRPAITEALLQRSAVSLSEVLDSSTSQ